MEEEGNCSKLEEALKVKSLRRIISARRNGIRTSIDMNQDIDVDEDENLVHALDEHLQTQTQNTQ